MSRADPVRLTRAGDHQLAPGQTPGMVRPEAFVDEHAWVAPAVVNVAGPTTADEGT